MSTSSSNTVYFIVLIVLLIFLFLWRFILLHLDNNNLLHHDKYKGLTKRNKNIVQPVHTLGNNDNYFTIYH